MDEIGPVDPGGQGHRRAAGILIAILQRRVRHDRGDRQPCRARQIEHGIRADPDRIAPGHRAVPHVGAQVLAYPADFDLGARQGSVGGRGDVDHAQVPRRGRDVGSAVGHIVGLVAFADAGDATGALVDNHMHVLPGHARGQVDGFAAGVAGVHIQRAGAVEGPDPPGRRPRCAVDRVVGQVDHVAPQGVPVNRAGAKVLDRPGHGQRLAPRYDGGAAGHLLRHQVRQARGKADHVNRAALVIVAVEFVGVVGVLVAGQRVLDHKVGTVGPGGDEIAPGRQGVGDADLDLAGIAVVLTQHAVTGDRRQEDRAVALAEIHVARIGDLLQGAWAARVQCDPDRVGPAAREGLVQALVGDRVADLDL